MILAGKEGGNDILSSGDMKRKKGEFLIAADGGGGKALQVPDKDTSPFTVDRGESTFSKAHAASKGEEYEF